MTGWTGSEHTRSAMASLGGGLLAALTAQRLSEAGDRLADVWGCAARAHGVETAHAAASELALLTGAS
ncbi:MAG TPA: hypothetical protein VFQ44_30755 [Streptosporangiaceae bacterium]|nr:hypothetical protein [Streptosporangiaceae bacterium]